MSRNRSAEKAVIAQLKRTVEHVAKNARALAEMGDVNEARARMLAALYLDEALDVFRLDDEIAAIDRRTEQLRARLAKALADLEVPS